MTDMTTIDERTRVVADTMSVQMARLLTGSRNVFHGLASPLPAAAIRLAQSYHNPDLEYLNIAGGVDAAPESLSISTCSPTFLEGSRSFFSLTDIFDLCARGRLDTAFLGGVQVDRAGRINNSVIGPFETPKVKLPGGAGSAAIVPRARRTIVWRTRHDHRSIVDSCSFVTASGSVQEVVTPLGVLRMEAGELRIAGWFSYSSHDEIVAQTGFAITDTADCGAIAAPSDAEIATLRTVDPAGIRYSEF